MTHVQYSSCGIKIGELVSNRLHVIFFFSVNKNFIAKKEKDQYTGSVQTMKSADRLHVIKKTENVC
jgi:hypothetical protein